MFVHRALIPQPHHLMSKAPISSPPLPQSHIFRVLTLLPPRFIANRHIYQAILNPPTMAKVVTPPIPNLVITPKAAILVVSVILALGGVEPQLAIRNVPVVEVTILASTDQILLVSVIPACPILKAAMVVAEVIQRAHIMVKAAIIVKVPTIASRHINHLFELKAETSIPTNNF